MTTADERKPLLSIAIIGHVDSGKSTLTGRLATIFGGLDKRTKDKLDKIATENNKSSFTLAYYSDKTVEERKRGVTINTTLVNMQTKKYEINFLDCPGHADYIKNAVSGCKQSDLSIVVVPANFQASCSEDGTLKNHLTLAAILGSKNFIVCINKLDEIERQLDGNMEEMKTRFDAARAAVLELLSKLAVKKEDVIFLPISALEGIGIFSKETIEEMGKGENEAKFYGFFKGAEPPKGSDWDKTKKIMCLEDAINAQPVPMRQLDKPLRMPITKPYKVDGQGMVFSGRIDYGMLKKKDTIKILPSELVTEIKTMEANHNNIELAKAGDNIGFTVLTKSLDALNSVATGHVVGPTADPEFTVAPFYKVNCISMKPKGKAGLEERGIRVGYSPVLNCGASSVTCKFVKLIGTTDKNGKIVQADPEFVSKGARFFALIHPTRLTYAEDFRKAPSLGKFVMRDSGILVCCGQILERVSEADAKNIYGVDLSELTQTKGGSAQKSKKKAKK